MVTANRSDSSSFSSSCAPSSSSYSDASSAILSRETSSDDDALLDTLPHPKAHLKPTKRSNVLKLRNKRQRAVVARKRAKRQMQTKRRSGSIASDYSNEDSDASYQPPETYTNGRSKVKKHPIVKIPLNCKHPATTRYSLRSRSILSLPTPLPQPNIQQTSAPNTLLCSQNKSKKKFVKRQKVDTDSATISITTLSLKELRLLLSSVNPTLLHRDFLNALNAVKVELKPALIELSKSILDEFGIDSAKFVRRRFQSFESLKASFLETTTRDLSRLTERKFLTRRDSRAFEHNSRIILLKRHVLVLLTSFLTQEEKLRVSSVCKDFLACIQTPSIWEHLDVSCIFYKVFSSRTSGRIIYNSKEKMMHELRRVLTQPAYSEIKSINLMGFPGDPIHFFHTATESLHVWPREWAYSDGVVCVVHRKERMRLRRVLVALLQDAFDKELSMYCNKLEKICDKQISAPRETR